MHVALHCNMLLWAQRNGPGRHGVRAVPPPTPRPSPLCPRLPGPGSQVERPGRMKVFRTEKARLGLPGPGVPRGTQAPAHSAARTGPVTVGLGGAALPRTTRDRWAPRGQRLAGPRGSSPSSPPDVAAAHRWSAPGRAGPRSDLTSGVRSSAPGPPAVTHPPGIPMRAQG